MSDEETLDNHRRKRKKKPAWVSVKQLKDYSASVHMFGKKIESSEEM